MGKRCEFDAGRLRDHDCRGDAPYVVTYAGGLRGPVAFAACLVAAREIERVARERTSYGYGVVAITSEAGP